MQSESPRYYEFGEYRLDARRRILSKNGKRISLAGRNFDLLLFLVENEGRILEHDELLDNVWQGTFVEQSNLKKGIWVLRKLLEDSADEDFYIKTVPRQGYSFVAPVRALPDDETQALLLSETEIILERKTEETDDENDAKLLAARKTRKFFLVGAGVLILLIGGAISWQFFQPASIRRGSAFSFDKAQMMRLTSIGNVLNAVISPDGNYAAYVVHTDDGQSLWLKQISTGSARQIIAPEKVSYFSWNFTADSSFIYFIRQDQSDSARDGVYRIPFLGGDERKIAEGASGHLCFSPDGKRLAFVRFLPDKSAAIITTDLEGGDENQIAENSGRVWNLNWSPDSQTLLWTKEQAGGAGVFYYAAEISAEGGAEEKIIVPPQKQKLRSAVWLADKSGLILNAEDPETEMLQLWFQPFPNGERARLTNDLNSYQYFSLAKDGRALVSLRESSASSLTVLDLNGKNSREIISASSLVSVPSWTTDNRIVFSSYESGRVEIWSAERDGSSKKQLTLGNGKNFRPAVSADGKTITFVSTRTGRPQIWQMDADGRNAVQLTDSDGVSYGRLAPDGKNLLYYRWVSPTGWTIFKQPGGGGEAVPVTDTEIGAWEISPDGKLLAYEFLDKETNRKRILLRKFEGGEPIRIFDFKPAYFRLCFTPDGKAIAYATKIEGRSKIILQPLDGGAPSEIADFGTDLIFWFDLSKDGKQIALASGNPTNDAVLFKFGDK